MLNFKLVYIMTKSVSTPTQTLIPPVIGDSCNSLPPESSIGCKLNKILKLIEDLKTLLNNFKI
jgi:hypothetical protein